MDDDLFIEDAITGLIMGWKYARRKSIVLLTLAAGVLIPAILVFV
jgi:hypothetical protein